MTEPSSRDWIPQTPYKPDWKTADGMLLWLGARMAEVERSVPPGDGQSIVQQVIDTEIPMLRVLVQEAITSNERIIARHTRDKPWTECRHCKLTWPCVDYEDAVVALAALKGNTNPGGQA